MTVQKRTDFSTILSDLQKRVGTLERTSRLNSASIGSGGLTIRDEGDLTLRDGGDFFIQDGGNVFLNDAGQFVISPGGIFRSLYSNGETAAYFGPLLPDDVYDQGFLLSTPEDDAIIWLARKTNGDYQANLGAGSNARLQRFQCFAQDVYLEASDQLWADGSTEVGLFTGGSVRFFANNTGTSLYSEGLTSQVHIRDSGITLVVNTTAAGANAHLTAGNVLLKSTSSRRYKSDIKDAPTFNLREVINLRLRTFRDKRAAKEDPENAPTYTGLVAEEVAEAPSLRPFVTFNEKGEPDAIQYDRLWLSLLPVVKDQQRRIEELEKQVEILASRLDALTQEPRG